MKTPVASGLEALLEPNELIRDRPRLEDWAIGGRAPEVVALPRSVEQLADVMGRASEEGWPVVPAGAGRWLDGGGLPEDARVVVSTQEMKGVREYEPGDLTLTGDAGLPLPRIQEVAGESGQWLPQDPPGWERATLGAFVSTGLPGPLVAGFGRPRDLLLGITAVTGDGRVVRPGGRVVKNVAGYDLVRLLAGSWGTLAVVAGATVRLFPRPERDVTLLFGAATPGGLVETGRALATAPVVPDALELLVPPPTVEGLENEGAGGGVGGAVLAVRLLGSREAVAEEARLLREAAGRRPDIRLRGAESGAFHDRAAAPRGAVIALRLSLLPAHLDRLIEAGEGIRDRARDRGCRVRLTGHVTRGVLRVEVEAEGSGDASGRKWGGMLAEVQRRLETDGGSLRAVRAPRRVAEALGSRASRDGATRRILQGLKEEFDPAGVLAPGRLGLP